MKRKRDDLESQLRHQRARTTSNMATEDIHTPVSAVRGPQLSQPEMAQTNHDPSDSTVQAAMGEIGFLSRSAMAEPRDETSGFSQELAVGRMVRAALALLGANPAQSVLDPSSHKIAAMLDQSVSIKEQLARPFVTQFLQIMEPQFAHIDSSEYWDEFNTFFKEPNASGGRTSVRTFNIYICIATGMLLSAESRSLDGIARNLHAAAMKLFPDIMESSSRIDILRCMLSLIIYSMHGTLGGSTWHLVGLAMKKAIAFRFHKDPDPGVEISEEALHSRQRIFWSLYTIDRLVNLECLVAHALFSPCYRTISTITDRPFSIEDDDITVQVSILSKQHSKISLTFCPISAPIGLKTPMSITHQHVMLSPMPG